VFLCLHRGPGGFEKRLVMKVLRSKFAGDDEYIQMFLDEAWLLSRMQHPNIVDVFEVDCVDGVPYLLMAHVNGPTLGKLHQRALRMHLDDLGCFLHLVVQVCSALHYAHTLRIDGEHAGIVHRDVSAQNILIDGETGTVKLIDFGIAKANTGQADTDLRIIKGKIPYMAPEVLQGERADLRADLYAVGILLYRIVTNQQPLAKGDDIVSARLAGRDPRPSEIVPGVSRQLDAIIERALQPDPLDRYQSAAELAQDLQGEIDRLGIDPSRIGDWLRAVFPGGEDDWSQHYDDGALAASTMYPSLVRLVNRTHTPAPSRVARKPRRWGAITGIVAAFLVLLAFGSLIGFAGIALHLSGAEAPPSAAVVDPTAPYLVAADELLASRELDAARVMNRMAEELGASDPAALVRIARQRAEIDRASGPVTSLGVAMTAAAPPTAAPPPPIRVERAPVVGGGVAPAEPTEVVVAPAVVEPVPEAMVEEEAAVPVTTLVGPVGGAARDGGHRAVVSDVKVFHQTELRVKSRSDLRYPTAARALNLGDHRCLAKVFIDEKGVPYDVIVESCPRAFFEDTRRAILAWRWYPPTDGVEACKALTTIAVNYKLGT
jgi:serine/threonine protein kinase